MGFSSRKPGYKREKYHLPVFLLFDGDRLLDDVCDAETGTAADLAFDTCCESEASGDVDLDAMFSFDTGFKL